MHKIKAYQQLEHSDCGMTCIRVIARYYGQVVPLGNLRAMCDVGRIGMSLRSIVECLRNIGFRAEAVKLPMDKIEHMPLPAVLYWDHRHYVVLYGVGKNGERFKVVDPSVGKIKVSRADFIKHWIPYGKEGMAVVADPTDEFYSRRYEREENPLAGLWRLMKSSMRSSAATFVCVFLLSLLTVVGDIFTPILFQRSVDDGINGHDIPLIWMLIAAQFGIFVGNYVSNVINELLLTKVGMKLGLSMLNDYLSKLLHLPIAFFDRKVNSDLLQKVEDQKRIRDFLLAIPGSLLLTILNVVVFSAMLIYYNPSVFALFIIGTGLSAAWTVAHLHKRKVIDYALFSSSSENRNNVYEIVEGMQDIKISNAQERRMSVWDKVQNEVNRLTMRLTKVNIFINSGNAFLTRIKDIAITGLCATLVVKNEMTIGEMMTISYIVGNLSSPFSSMIGLMGTIQNASMSYQRLEEVVDSEDTEKGKTGVADSDLTVVFDKVSFKYPGSGSRYVIGDLSLTIERGKTIAIVGESGCGKTTLLKLILGFYKPQQGTVSVGGVDLEKVNKEDWLAHCGAVMQSGYVFSGTIADNIALSEEHPDLGKVREAARIASIDDFFSSLPMGYDTCLGNAGIELSGGQKQRLLIARAIYGNPSFLLLDEATSSLDANNESAIVHNLLSYCKDRTVVIAAHRLSTIRHADKIVFMDKGRIAEEGTHEELIARQGAYFRLVKEQMGPVVM